MKKNSVVIYKNSCALVDSIEGDKFLVNWCVSRATAGGKKAVYASQKVRLRDVILLSEEPASSLDSCLDFAESSLAPQSEVENQIKEIHELLLSDSETAATPLLFSELVELIRGSVKSGEVWGVYCALKKDFCFEEKTDLSDTDNVKLYFIPRSLEKIEELKNKQK